MSVRDPRSLVAASFLVAAFVTSLFFHGTGDNLVALVAAATLLLLAVTSVGTERLCAAVAGAPGPSILAGATLVVLVLNFQWSLSKDTSFGAAWVLAGLPISFLIARGLDGERRQWLAHALIGCGVLLAAISFFRLLAFGERARLPLTDPNNYATLLYLLWIPWVHQALVRRWRGEPRNLAATSVEVGCSFLLVAGVFATQSRTALLIVGVALILWFAIALYRKLSLSAPMLHTVAAALAMASVLLASPPDFVANRVASLGIGVSVRLDLMLSGWHMYVDHPVTGVGAFCFGLMYSAYRPLSEQVTGGLFVHNDYVQLLAEGGVLLLSVALAFAIGTARQTLRGLNDRDRGAQFESLGYALAAGAACAHAAVNFVFFILPLGILLGVIAALMIHPERMSHPEKMSHPEDAPGGRGSTPAIRASILASIAFGWIALAYLTLDLVTAAVLQGQKGVPFAISIREDPEAQLRYATFAQRLNADRGVPILGEALLMAKKSADPTAPKAYVERALLLFRRAIATDPWNPRAYVSLAKLVAQHGADLPVREEESPERLMLTALGIDPVDVSAIDGLLSLHASQGRFGDSYGLLKTVVFPWLELLKRRDDVAAERYIAEMLRLARMAGDQDFLVAVEAKAAALEDVKPAVYRLWYE